MKIKDIVEARMSAAVRLQRAFEREQSKSTASKQRADQAKADFEKEWEAKQEKEKQGVAEGSGFDQEAGIGIDGKSFKFKIRDLVALADNYPVTKIDPQQFSKQIAGRDEDSTQSMARAEKADLQYPIIVVKRQNGQLWIADGTHRAHKAIMHKLPSINAKIIPIKDMAPFDVDQGVAENLKSKMAAAATVAANLLGSPAQAAEEPIKPITIAYVTIEGEVKKYNLGDKFTSSMEAEKFISGVLDKQGLQGYHLEIKHGYPKKKNEDAAGVGIITKQNTTADVDKNTPKKNLRAFRL